MSKILEQARSRLQVHSAKTGPSKPKKLKGGTLVYTGEGEDTEVTVTFEDAKWDFDALSGALNLFNNVPPKNVFTRDVRGKDKVEMLVVLNAMLKNIPITKLDQAKRILSPDMFKDYSRYVMDLQDAINYVQDLS
jgi:hypothetical protein